MKIKINCYDKTGKFKNRIGNIKNIDMLEFNEIRQGGQGNFNIEIAEKFDNNLYQVGDFIEYIIFDEKNKSGLHKYTGVIRGIERYYSIIEGEGITLQVEGIVSLLSDFKIEKTYSGNLYDVVETFINDFHKKINISNKMQYFGDRILKNGLKKFIKWQDLDKKTFLDYNGIKYENLNEIPSTSININQSVNGTFFQALDQIFSGARTTENDNHFFINALGEILLIEENTKRNIFTLNKNISEININQEGETIINLINIDKKISIGDFILLQNINKNLNLSGKRINELAFGIDKIVINVGKIKDYKNIGIL